MNLIKHRLLTASAFEAKVKLKWERCRTTIVSLMYNDFCDQSYVVDVCMEPIFWFVNNFTTVLGPLFVVAVCFLTCSIVAICYWIGVPYYWKKSPTFTIFLMVIGHWLLVNNVFHYFMAVRTPPGYPPENRLITEAVSICKKCISPKPPRTHHCSICNRCILKMDHHCPWINNCVGYSNHRYFYLYMCYTIIGVSFIILCGFNIVIDGLWYANFDEELEGHPVTFDHTGAIIPMAEMSLNVSDVQFGDFDDEDTMLKLTLWERRSLIYMVLINVGVLVALGGLLWLHTQLISRGETCIESHINKSETKRLAADNKIYVNPYNFGRKKNWKLFLGVARGRTWFRYVILPSAHIPEGDGLSWITVHDSDLTDWP